MPAAVPTTPAGWRPELALWSEHLARPAPEAAWPRTLAHVGAVTAWLSLLAFLTWRVTSTLPPSGTDRVAALLLVGFEALPLFGLAIRTVTLWDLDRPGPDPVHEVRPGVRTVVMIPTYNEPVEIIAPTIAAACALEPAHATWVLDDGDRDWLEELCAEYGARYVRRAEHDHAKAGNMNHAFALMDAETADGAEPFDVVAVLDCDHVPLPHFLTGTLGWFEDADVALVQGPQTYYNAGAFDDDGISGEQGMFFHVLLPGRNHDGAGPFWCGSTSLLRIDALRQVGWVATQTIVEDMHTTLGLIRDGWKTVYHHQILALGLAPETAEQYLLQRRRWAMGSMQVLTHEKLWGAKRWLSWRNYYEYLGGTVWWLEGVATLGMFLLPVALLASGAQTSTASPAAFVLMMTTTMFLRLWGTKRLFRGHLHLPTAFALRIFRIPIGLACAWWLLTRRSLVFQVTPKSGTAERQRGRVPTVLVLLLSGTALLLGVSVAGSLGLVPWRATPGATVASAAWLVVALVALFLGARRIHAADFATSRRNAHRVPVRAGVCVDGLDAELTDLSLGGAAVRVPGGHRPGSGTVDLVLPGAPAVRLEVVRVATGEADAVWSLRVRPDDWAAYRTLALWLFHTPDGAVPALPSGVPAVAVRP